MFIVRGQAVTVQRSCDRYFIRTLDIQRKTVHDGFSGVGERELEDTGSVQ